jgi:hypothetical protein
LIDPNTPPVAGRSTLVRFAAKTAAPAEQNALAQFIGKESR